MGTRVLVVDDNADIRNMLQLMLEAKGMEISSAADGRQALERLSENLPDIILLDLMMPVMDGWEFAATVAQDPRFESIPIIVVSAFADPKRPVPAVATIAKPFDFEDLVSTVNKYASQSTA